IANGRYILKTFKEGSGEFTSAPAFFDITKDFTLEAAFVQRDGSINNGIGLYWGYVSGKIYNLFVFTTNGYYKVGESGAEGWVQTDLVKPLNEENFLKVQRRGTTLSYFLNGKLLATNQLASYGFTAGFINYTNMTLEVDNFHFDQDNAINLAVNAPTGLQKENLGTGVNSTAFDLLPNISADGKALYLVRKYHEQNTGGKEDASDIWVSEWDSGKWNLARNLREPVNSTGVDNLTAVSADNNTVFLIRGSKFVSSKRLRDGWSPPEDLGLSYTTESEYMESSLSADGKVLLVTLKTPGNLFYQGKIDEKDVYVSLQNKGGSWSDFINLGPNVNSAGDETSPFLSPDGRTLYFSTTGRPGFGGSDIFMSKRLGDDWITWSEPVNLGPSINTSEFDAYYTVPASGDYAYMVSRRNSIGETDIVRLKLPQAIKPDPVILISGKTINAKTKDPVTAEILLDNLGTGKEVAEAFSDPRTGAFKIVLPPGANYGLHAAAKGFLSVNENLELVSIKEYAELEKNLFLVPIEVGVSLQLNNVFFEQGKPVLRPESYPELDRLVQILKDNSGVQIELAGYTDNVGTQSALIKLSQDRVTAVINYLASKEVSRQRLTGKGYGAMNPLVRNDTEEHRKMNRRVEFKITKK
ncbi:MAG TPA: OmpA family protein, partial [Cyclobacteriaceae bacterium]|nr:OmpA family protein [Cyclobacteriaceae bacterium]